jgi:hypothetical protein
MAWVLRLVETGIDGPARVIDVTDIRPLGALGDISKLGLMLSEAKQILARLQQAVVAIQADDHAVLRPVCAHSAAQPKLVVSRKRTSGPWGS